MVITTIKHKQLISLLNIG